MSVRAYWVNEEKTVVRYDFEGNWTWDELYPVFQEALAMERSVPHRVDVILDMTRAGRLPANALLHVKNISDKQPDNIGLTVIVSPNQFVGSLYTIGVRFYAKIAYYFRVTKTFDEANAVIAAAREEASQK